MSRPKAIARTHESMEAPCGLAFCAIGIEPVGIAFAFFQTSARWLSLDKHVSSVTSISLTPNPCDVSLKWFSIPKICQYFRTRSPVTMADIDGWHARDLVAPLFFNDNTDLHNLIRKRLILPYLTGSFHPSMIEEYAQRTSDGTTETRRRHSPHPLCRDLETLFCKFGS